jgi:serine phosphatase RsbU (regulator of sigma subunit)
VLALVVLAATVAVHLTLAPINGAFALAAIIASTTLSVSRTAAIGVVCIVCSLLVGFVDPHDDTMAWLIRAALCAVISAVAVLTAVNRVGREQQLTRMTAIADAAQQALLRPLPTKIGPVGLAARHVSATANALIGGDLYEAVSTPHGVRIIIGDVRGKGLDAVQLAATVLGAFRQAAAVQPDLPSLVKAIDAVVSAVTGDEDFVTALLVQVTDDGGVRLVSCGHHPPIFVAPDGAASTVDTGPATTPLGLSPRPSVATPPLPVGGRLLLYTDGLVEARDPSGRFFPLGAHMDALAHVPLPQALEALVARLLSHTGRRLHDDMAVLLIERSPAMAPA